MAKNLFKNYTYEFDKNDKKILSTFCNQIIKQLSNDSKYFAEVNSFNSILAKLNKKTDEPIKLTKDEKTRLVLQLQENVKFLKKQIDKSWFLKKWLYKSMYTQYNNLIQNYFRD
ncbi:hypothetical protein ABRY23_07835 [Melioribacteraceae bacterium 4301-Me]|uniref:hypothetical protein n=1 Tax=Pyranulibacter aquaticus TaxID=3163344 RepID=UPI003595E32F